MSSLNISEKNHELLEELAKRANSTVDEYLEGRHLILLTNF